MHQHDLSGKGFLTGTRRSGRLGEGLAS